MDNKENEVVYLKIEDIMPNRFQPREEFDETGLEELSDSIKEHGVLQPILVRPKNGKYELIAGERRCKASSLAGLTTVPAIIREMDDRESAKVSLLENLQRKNLSAIEEARTYKRILELDNMTQESLAKTMGRSQPAIANKLRLLGLPEEVQDALMKNQISERHARSLLNLKDKEQQLMMLDRIRNERLTVRELDAEIKKLKEESSNNMDEGESDMNNNMMNNQNSNNFNMNNDMPMNNFGQQNSRQNNMPSFHGNFGGMGLNDYQSSINGGMFNNIPNFNNQNPSNMPNNPTFGNNFSNDFNDSSVYNDNQNSNNEPNQGIDYGDFKDTPGFAMPQGNNNSQMNSNNNFSSLGSMFDGAPNINNSNNNPNYNANEGDNPFVSQIRENAIKPKENQFLPNFDTPNNFDNNQNSFEDNSMNNFEQEQDFGMNNFINQNNNNNFNPNPNNNFNMNNMNDNMGNMNNNINNMGNMNNFNNPIDDFSFPKQNNNDMSPIDFNANQGGLFNQPLNIVNVPDNNQMNDYNMNDNRPPRNEPRFDDNYQELNQENNEKFDNPFDDPYEDILNAKPVSVKEEKEEIQKEEPTEQPEKHEEEQEEMPKEEVEEVEVIGAEPTGAQEEKEEKEETTSDTKQEKKNDYIVLEPVKTIFDARGAVYELKKTTDAIKQNNISIDTEEIEFDDYYQITIKIKK